jgi:proteasome lid subunit RPN8/RPN11
MTVTNDERAGLGYVSSHPPLSRRTHTIDRNRFIPHKQEPHWLVSQVPYESHLTFNTPDRWVGSVHISNFSCYC